MCHIVLADLDSPQHQTAILQMTAAYAADEMGNCGPLPSVVMDRLIEGLRNHPTTLVFLAFDGDQPIGIATCFLGFSTFAARPLVNVHDLSVVPACRGRGIGRKLLAAVEQEARRRDCVKLTLEVLEHNSPARGLYESCGFAQATYKPELGGSLFYAKPL